MNQPVQVSLSTLILSVLLAIAITTSGIFAFFLFRQPDNTAVLNSSESNTNGHSIATNPNTPVEAKIDPYEKIVGTWVGTGAFDSSGNRKTLAQLEMRIGEIVFDSNRRCDFHSELIHYQLAEMKNHFQIDLKHPDFLDEPGGWPGICKFQNGKLLMCFVAEQRMFGAKEPQERPTEFKSVENIQFAFELTKK